MIQQLTVDAKMDLIRRNLRLEDVPEVPFLVEFGPNDVAVTQYFNDDQAELAKNIDFHKKRDSIYDYGFPNVKPNVGIGIIAAAFGCEQIPNDKADPRTKPLIYEKNLQDVYNLEVPDPVTNPVFKRVWERIEFFQNHSNLPLRAANIPSPLVTASLIWDYTSFIEALIIYPKEVHILMEKVTEATIGYAKEQFQRIKNLYSVGHQMWYIPREAGIRISDDTSTLLSPNLYREFGVRYNSIIAKAFGGIIVHSCGDVQNVVAPMMETKNLKGLDFTLPNNPNWEAIRNNVAGKTALYLRHWYWDHKNTGVDPVMYSKKILDFFGRKGLFIQTSTETLEEAIRLSTNLHQVLSK